ncbi:TasA family protein [Burkholderia sp. RS01]|uniref:TasA family protein n=1 Tax=unclassified Burkholderia TaxID=2613784 RepID=UPI003218AD3D
MSVIATPSVRRPNPRLLAAFAVGAAGLAITGGGVFAALNATASNTTAQNATSGILSLTMADNGAGFTQAISNLAPGDTVNRYVNLTQGSSLDGKALTLGVSAAAATKLTTDATNGLHVTVTQCNAGTWTPGTGICSGTPAVLVTNAALSTLITTPASVVGGAVAKGSVLNLQISTTLPDQTETTTNGVVPGATIQGLSSSLTWTFTDTQRTASTTTN